MIHMLDVRDSANQRMTKKRDTNRRECCEDASGEVEARHDRNLLVCSDNSVGHDQESLVRCVCEWRMATSSAKDRRLMTKKMAMSALSRAHSAVAMEWREKLLLLIIVVAVPAQYIITQYTSEAFPDVRVSLHLSPPLSSTVRCLFFTYIHLG